MVRKTRRTYTNQHLAIRDTQLFHLLWCWPWHTCPWPHPGAWGPRVPRSHIEYLYSNIPPASQTQHFQLPLPTFPPLFWRMKYKVRPDNQVTCDFYPSTLTTKPSGFHLWNAHGTHLSFPHHHWPSWEVHHHLLPSESAILLSSSHSSNQFSNPRDYRPHKPFGKLTYVYF